MKYFSDHLKNFPSDILTNKEKRGFVKLIQNFQMEERQFEDSLESLLRRCQNKQIRDSGKGKR